MRRLRLPAAVILAAVLLCSPWLTCLPLCLAVGHGDMGMAPAHLPVSTAPCHSGPSVRHQIPMSSAPTAMLPSAWAPVLPLLPPALLPQPPAPSIHRQQIPSADTPPPRFA